MINHVNYYLRREKWNIIPRPIIINIFFKTKIKNMKVSHEHRSGEWLGIGLAVLRNTCFL